MSRSVDASASGRRAPPPQPAGEMRCCGRRAAGRQAAGQDVKRDVHQAFDRRLHRIPNAGCCPIGRIIPVCRQVCGGRQPPQAENLRPDVASCALANALGIDRAAHRTTSSTARQYRQPSIHTGWPRPPGTRSGGLGRARTQAGLPGARSWSRRVGSLAACRTATGKGCPCQLPKRSAKSSGKPKNAQLSAGAAAVGTTATSTSVSGRIRSRAEVCATSASTPGTSTRTNPRIAVPPSCARHGAPMCAGNEICRHARPEGPAS